MYERVSAPVGDNGSIDYFTTAGAFPGVKRTDEIIKLFRKHTTFTTWTIHVIPPESFFQLPCVRLFT